LGNLPRLATNRAFRGLASGTWTPRCGVQAIGSFLIGVPIFCGGIAFLASVLSVRVEIKSLVRVAILSEIISGLALVVLLSLGFGAAFLGFRFIGSAFKYRVRRG
jgi:hypothetical protein